MRKLATVMLASALVACSSQPTFEYDYDRAYDFSSVNTYRWYDDQVSSREADYRKHNASDRRVRDAVAAELKKKGLHESSSGRGDIWLNYSVAHQKQRIERTTGYGGSGLHGSAAAGSYGRGVSVGYSSGPSIREYDDGTAVLDVIDAKTQRIVWRGIAEGRLKNNRSVKDKRKTTITIARDLLANFPPTPENAPK